jgi:hypothetical protein
VVDIVERRHPWRIAWRRRARSLLELSAGECACRGVWPGDQLEIRDHRSANGILALNRPEPELVPALLDLGGEVSRLRPIRVLVVSRDRRYLGVTSMLLSRRGCSVAASANGGPVVEAVGRHRADVVVVDMTQVEAADMVTAIRGHGLTITAEDAGGHVQRQWGRDDQPERDPLRGWERHADGQGPLHAHDHGHHNDQNHRERPNALGLEQRRKR